MPDMAKNENNDLCFTIDDVVFFNSYASGWVCIILFLIQLQ
jgi:hypothetical protein